MRDAQHPQLLALRLTLQAGAADSELRAARRARVLAMMAERGLDVCLFARECNVRYVSGAQRLWIAGTRVFAPTCVVVRATGDVHLMTFSPSREGLPPEIRPEHTFIVTWAPENFISKLSAIPGISNARRIGVDGMSAYFASSLETVSSGCEFEDAHSPMTQLRRVKLPGEILQIRRAVAVAEGAVGAAVAIAAPGAFEHELHGAFLSRMYALGSTAFSAAGPFAILDGAQGERTLGGRRMIADGDLVAIGGRRCEDLVVRHPRDPAQKKPSRTI
jgi:Xaa-Pro dipeptidase